MMFERDDPLLRPAVAAKRLGVCTETIWRWIRKGVMPCERIGPYQKIRIRTSVVDSMNVPRATTSDDNQQHPET
jgi:excisionase family DNA binding protein